MRDQICRQNQDPLVIFKLAQEYSNKGITLNVRTISLRKEYVCFVEENNRFPPLREFQNLSELLFHIVELSAQFTRREAVKGASGYLNCTV